MIMKCLDVSEGLLVVSVSIFLLGGVLMPEYHRGMVAECVRLATKTDDPFDKALYLEMAQNLLKLADRLFGLLERA